MSDTVRNVCAEMRKELNQSWWDVDRKKVHDIPDRILAAYEREITTKDEMARIVIQSAQARFDEEMAEKDAEIARLRTALKPILACNEESCRSFGDHYIMLDDAVNEAKRIINEDAEVFA